MTALIGLASPQSRLFDNSPAGQAEWSRLCSSASHSLSASTESLPYACFTIHDDITTAAHSSSHPTLGYASASGQDFVVLAPDIKGEEGSKVEFFASGYWIHVTFSKVTGCAKVDVRAPSRAPNAGRTEGQEPALEPFLLGTSCSQGDQKTFRL